MEHQSESRGLWQIKEPKWYHWMTQKCSKRTIDSSNQIFTSLVGAPSRKFKFPTDSIRRSLKKEFNILTSFLLPWLEHQVRRHSRKDREQWRGKTTPGFAQVVGLVVMWCVMYVHCLYCLCMIDTIWPKWRGNTTPGFAQCLGVLTLLFIRTICTIHAWYHSILGD